MLDLFTECGGLGGNDVWWSGDHFTNLMFWLFVMCVPSRWVRLLFGREFPLQDLLALWDAIFADGRSLSLVDYIFVAMLQHIRDACKSLLCLLALFLLVF